MRRHENKEFFSRKILVSKNICRNEEFCNLVYTFVCVTRDTFDCPQKYKNGDNPVGIGDNGHKKSFIRDCTKYAFNVIILLSDKGYL